MSFLQHVLPRGVPLRGLLCGIGVAVGSIGFYYYFSRRRKKAVEPAFTINDGEEDENQAEGKVEHLCESVVETVVDDGEVKSPQEVLTTHVPEDAAEASLDEMVEITVTSNIDGESHTLEDEKQAEAEPEVLCESVVETVEHDGEVKSPQEFLTTQVPEDAAETALEEMVEIPVTSNIEEEHHVMEDERQSEAEPEQLCESVVETLVDDGEVNSPQEVLTTQVPEETVEASLEVVVKLTVTSSIDGESHTLEDEKQAEAEPEVLCESVVETVVDDGEVNSPQEVLTTQVPEETVEASLEVVVKLTVTSTIDGESHTLEDEKQAEVEPKVLCESVVETHGDQTTQATEDTAENNTAQSKDWIRTTHPELTADQHDTPHPGAKVHKNLFTDKDASNQNLPQKRTTQRKGRKNRKEVEIQEGQKGTQQSQPETFLTMTSLPPTVWIIGDNYIGCGEETARMCLGTNLGVNANITWIGEVGLRWRELMPFFCKSLEERGRVPDILVIHCGGNDLAEMSSVHLASQMKKDLRDLHQCYPKMKIILSEITQRCYWRNANPKTIEPSRTWVNRRLDGVAWAVRGCVVHHSNIVGDDSRLYLRDGVNLSSLGNVIFFNNITDCLKSLIQF